MLTAQHPAYRARNTVRQSMLILLEQATPLLFDEMTRYVANELQERDHHPGATL